MQYDNNGQVTNVQCCGGTTTVTPAPPFTAGVLHGFGSPIVNGIAPTNGTLYINDTDATIWAVANGVWHQEV